MDPRSGVYKICGRSIPIHVEEFYAPILDWADRLKKEPVKSIQFVFKMEFFNIASSKRILLLLHKLKEMQALGTEVVVVWYYSRYDEDMLEIGHDYAVLIETIPFRYEEYDSALQDAAEKYKFG